MALLEEFGSDAVRYWACNGRPGTDTALDTGVMKIGRRLAIKVLNASRSSRWSSDLGQATGAAARPASARAARRRAARRASARLVDRGHARRAH